MNIPINSLLASKSLEKLLLYF